MGSTARRTEFISFLAQLLSYAGENGIELICTAFHRTEQQQAEIYAVGRTKPGKIITYKDGREKRSKHQDWEAIDLEVIKTRSDGTKFIEWNRTLEYEMLGEFWKARGRTWGGDWDINDIYHFEL